MDYQHESNFFQARGLLKHYSESINISVVFIDNQLMVYVPSILLWSN